MLPVGLSPSCATRIRQSCRARTAGQQLCPPSVTAANAQTTHLGLPPHPKSRETLQDALGAGLLGKVGIWSPFPYVYASPCLTNVQSYLTEPGGVLGVQIPKLVRLPVVSSRSSRTPGVWGRAGPGRPPAGDPGSVCLPLVLQRVLSRAAGNHD